MCKSFGKKQVFSDFSLSIPAHKITTVFGPSGSGKSTLLNIIGLLENRNSPPLRQKDSRNRQQEGHASAS